MINDVTDELQQEAGLTLGINKRQELARLVYEISRREHCAATAVVRDPALRAVARQRHLGPHDKFMRLKAQLISRRYPRAAHEKDFSVCFPRLDLPSAVPRRVPQAAPFMPEKIVIEESVRDSALARRVASLFPGIHPAYTPRLAAYRREHPAAPYDLRKRDLYIGRQQGDFVKPCPCSKQVLRCGYHIVNLGFGCPFDCTYCYLQQYANTPGILLDANIAEYLPTVEALLWRHAGTTLRVGTGEFTDSLALDHLTACSSTLIPFFASHDVLFELKTKSAQVAQLARLDHRGKTVISWSVNPPAIVAAEECGTASLEERWAAATFCQDHGYPVAFHFDPVIAVDGWRQAYEEVVNALFDTAPAPAWISIGTLRFHRSLKTVIEHRSPATEYIYGEMVTGADGKTRYYAALREEIYTAISGWIRRRNPATPVYLCMEDAAMWQRVFGGALPWWMHGKTHG